MSELKRTFTGGKMNKDLDERFVPKNQYRHGVNIQVRQSDTDSAGTVQNLLGNSAIGASYFADWMGDKYKSLVNQSVGPYMDWMLVNVNTSQRRDQVCIGNIADEKNDKAYFFFTNPHDPLDHIGEYETSRLFIDNIVEQSTSGITTRVVNDVWAITGRIYDILPVAGPDEQVGSYSTNSVGAGGIEPYNASNGIFIDDSALTITSGGSIAALRVKNIENFRVGMTMHGYSTGDFETDHFNVNGVNPKIVFVTENYVGLDIGHIGAEYDTTPAINIINDGGDKSIDYLMFKHERALNFKFKNRKHITGINIIDNLLFWTDNHSEPKKINIDRCKAGTFGNRHTKLYMEDVANNNALTDVASFTPQLEVHNGYYNAVLDKWMVNSDLQESHITVIRKAPTYAPTLEMSDSERASLGGSVDVNVEGYSFVTAEGEISEIELNVGDIRTINDPDIAGTRFRKDDILTITQTDVNILLESFIIIKAKFVCYEDEQGEEVFTGPTSRMRVRIISLSGAIVTAEDLNWNIKLDERQPLFETTFCRFGCRYKYEDGEYSSFGPWSKLAFLPGKFDYSAKNGYNLGMSNTVRELIIRDFIPYNIPLDVVAVDILYKATNNANVYTAQTITKNKSPEWDMFTPQALSTEITTGELYITSEMIHRVLPEMQLFRSWDNVPKYALAQEIVGNRLMYGNYFQGYNMENPIRLSQTISSESSNVLSIGYPTIKSLRNYKVGMVFGDKYGRETPVFTNGYVDGAGEDNNIAVTGDIYTDKSLSATKNKFVLSQDWANPLAPGVSATPPDWLVDGGYIKYFVKETSNEYYNLVLDRWYDAGSNDHIWLSFNSADRNKVDIETHLILKNSHTNQEPVYDIARYKVLAIKNEAPDYIRTRYANLGEVTGLTPDNTISMWANESADIYDSPSYLYNLDIPTAGQDGFSFTIDTNLWNTGSVGFSSDDIEGIFGKEIKGQLEMQFVGRRIDNAGGGIQYELESEWRKISNYNKTEGGDDPGVRFVWTKAYKSDNTGGVDFPTIYDQLFDVPFADFTLEWAVKFREAVRENRPEFDGKFFVKVNQDLALSQHVLGLGVGQGGVWVPEAEYQLAYIDSQYMNPALGDMGEEIDGGGTIADGTIITRESFWSNSSSYVQWFGSFNLMNSNYYVPPMPEGGLDYHFFDTPYWAGNLGNNSNSTNVPNIYYNGGDYDPNLDSGDGFNGIGYENLTGLLQVQYYGWGEGLAFNSTGVGVTPYMPFVPLEYIPELTDQVSEAELQENYFIPAEDSIWGVEGFVEFSYDSSTGPGGELVGLQFVPGAGGPEGGVQGEPPANPYGAGLFGGTCGPMFDWYFWNEATKDYWQNYAVNYAPGGAQQNDGQKSGGRVFMDGAGARRYITTIKNNEAWPGEVVRDSSGNIIPDHYYYEYYKPKALEFGTAPNANGTIGSDTHFGRMNLGVTLYNYKQSTAVNNASLFFDKMTTVGTVFRFSADPNAQVFKVIWVEDQPWFDDGTLGGPNSRMTSNVHKNTEVASTNDGFVINGENNQGLSQLNGTFVNNNNEIGTSQCPPIESNSMEGFDVGRRFNRAIEFRKINLETGATGVDALPSDPDDPFFFDPRAHIRHDGSSSMSVQIMRLGFDYGADSDESIAPTELGACFETEPKEDVGLDLYYEASNALPITLNRDNILNFAPIRSEVSILRRSSGGGVVKSIKFPGINLEVENVYSTHGSLAQSNSKVDSRGSIVSLARQTDGNPILYKNTFWIGDTIVFNHEDGTQTQTKILDFMRPVDADETLDGYFEGITSTDPNPGYYNYISNAYGWNEYISGAVRTPRLFASNGTETITINPNYNENDATSNGVLAISPGWNQASFVNEIVGSQVLSVEQNGTELTVPNGLFIENIVLNAFYWEGTGYHVLTFGGDFQGWVGNSGNISPVNGLSMTSSAIIRYKKRTGYYLIDPDVWKYPVTLGWFNCYGFGNGVESDRIRDDFNAPTITNGVKVSTTVVGYGEENISSGMIYSGLYNSTSQMNNLNEFNMADKITKDLNPAYGSIQALKTRDSDVVVLAEDKILKVIANKDAVFNADGNPQLIATNRVLGTSIPFSGDYGISKNPESLASDQYRLYFTDKQRGAVLRLSRDGLTPISNVGMKTYFRNQLRKTNDALGTFDIVSGEYNLTLSDIYEYSKPMNLGSAMPERYYKTLSFSEDSKGWVSFKTFVPESGVSISGTYITTKGGRIWRHYAPSFNEDGSCTGLWSQYGCVDRNSWYGYDCQESDIIMVFNDKPSLVKSFKTINYEGSQAKIDKVESTDIEWKLNNTETFYNSDFINLTDKDGWWTEEIQTDLETGRIEEFKQKEGKWFHQIGGKSWNYGASNYTDNANLNVDSLDIQGLGVASSVTFMGENIIAGCQDSSAGGNADINGDFSNPMYDGEEPLLDDEGNAITGGYLALNYNPSANWNDNSVCIYHGCSDYRKIGIDILQDDPNFGPGTPLYDTYLSSNYAGELYNNISCENDNGQVFNINNMENGWYDTSNVLVGPWVPTCCDYYFCKDPAALNYVGDELAPFVESCDESAISSISYNIDNLGYGQMCTPCEYDCGGGNIQGVGFDATCGCNNSNYLEYWNYTTDSNGAYILEQPELLTSYNNLPYNYNTGIFDEDSNPGGDCITELLYGCTNPLSFNYNDQANVDNGTCVPIIYGCIDTEMEVIEPVSGNTITVPTANYDPNANTSVGSENGGCIPVWPEGQLGIANLNIDTNF